MPRSDDFLKQIRENFDYDVQAWQDIREEAKEDRRYISGDPWPAEEKRQRATKGQERPCLAFDELNQYINQLVNGARLNKRGIKLTPMGNGATDELAEHRSNLIRNIEYRSKATVAYATALQTAAEGGYGYVTVSKRYTGERSFDQELCINRVANPDLIYLDPDCKLADCSDMKHAFEITMMRRREYEKRFRGAAMVDFTPEQLVEYPRWIKDDMIQLAAYWYVSYKKRKLVLIESGPLAGQAVFFDELGPELLQRYQIGKERTVEVPSVSRCLTNGVEILEEMDWDGKYIPIIPCFGKEMWIDTGSGEKKVLMSLVRLARPVYLAYCYTRTSQVELAGMSPKSVWLGAEGQFENHEQEFQDANRSPIPYLQYKPVTDQTSNQQLAPPQRVDFNPPIQNLEVLAEAFRRGIQAAMGITALPTAAQRQNEKSGVALERIQNQAATGSYHFIDSYDQMIEQTGRVIEDLIESTYDAPRDVGMTRADDTHEVIRINDPNAIDSKSGEPAHIDMTAGEFMPTVSTGPSQDSEREAVSEMADLLLNSPFAPRVADLAIRLRNLGPLGDEIAKRLTPPDIQAEQQGQQPIPPQVKAMMEQAQQKMLADQATIDALTMKVRELSDERFKVDQDNATKIQVEVISARKDVLIALAKEEGAAARAVLEGELRKLDAALGFVSDHLDRVHEAEQNQAQIEAAEQEPENEGAAA